jgi:hypothetical protein
MWFDDNKHVLGTVGMCIVIMQVRGVLRSLAPHGKPRGGQGDTQAHVEGLRLSPELSSLAVELLSLQRALL